MALFTKESDPRSLADTLPTGVRPLDERPDDTVAMPGSIEWRPLTTAADLIQREPRMAHEGTPLLHLVRLLRAERCGVVLVFDDDRQLSGVVTELDLVLHGYSRGKPTTAITAKDVMLPHPPHVRIDDSPDDVVQLMERRRLQWLPVVDDGNHVMGVISLDEISLRAEHDPGMREIIARVAERRSFWRRVWH